MVEEYNYLTGNRYPTDEDKSYYAFQAQIKRAVLNFLEPVKGEGPVMTLGRLSEITGTTWSFEKSEKYVDLGRIRTQFQLSRTWKVLVCAEVKLDNHVTTNQDGTHTCCWWTSAFVYFGSKNGKKLPPSRVPDGYLGTKGVITTM